MGKMVGLREFRETTDVGNGSSFGSSFGSIAAARRRNGRKRSVSHLCARRYHDHRRIRGVGERQRLGTRPRVSSATQTHRVISRFVSSKRLFFPPPRPSIDNDICSPISNIYTPPSSYLYCSIYKMPLGLNNPLPSSMRSKRLFPPSSRAISR